jgi:signal transduction histidine kinase/CheY-like chemotaxis protein
MQGEQLAEAERRQRIVSEISRVFLAYTGPDEVTPLREVVELVVAGLGDWCAFQLVDEQGFLRQVAAHHPDPRQRELGERALRMMPVQRWDVGSPETNPLLLGRPFFIEHLTDEMLRQGLPSQEAYELYTQFGLSSFIAAPMLSGSQPIGLMVLASTGAGGRSYSEHDIEFVMAIADRATLAVRNARLVRSIGQERDQAQARAAEMTAVFEADPNGLCLFGPDGRLRYASPRLEQLYNFPFKNHLGKHWHEIYDLLYRDVAEDQRAAAILRTTELFADQHATLSDDLPLERNEVRRVLHRSSVPVRDAAGHYVGRFFVFTDVTEARNLDRQRAEFLTVASHELRTPLTPLSMHLQAMERRLAKGQPVEPERVERARRQLERLTGLVDDLLDVSRFEVGRLDLTFERIEISQLAADVVGDFKSTHANGEVSLSLPATPFVVEADRRRIEQVLVNLLQNAAKYSAEGSRIEVRVEGHGKEVAVSVTDHGIGIPDEDREQVFQRFFRATNARVTNYGGLGMGLFISNEIVQRHGGRFEVKSVPGEGSTFTFLLPLAAPPRSSASPALSRILVIDDDPDILDSAADFLREEGYEVEEARNGVAALELIRRSPPQLILVDLMMPLLDGASFIQKLRQEHLAPDARIIILSADRAVSDKGNQLQVDGALSKPFDLDALDVLVKKLLKDA